MRRPGGSEIDNHPRAARGFGIPAEKLPDLSLSSAELAPQPINHPYPYSRSVNKKQQRRGQGVRQLQPPLSQSSYRRSKGWPVQHHRLLDVGSASGSGSTTDTPGVDLPVKGKQIEGSDSSGTWRITKFARRRKQTGREAKVLGGETPGKRSRLDRISSSYYDPLGLDCIHPHKRERETHVGETHSERGRYRERGKHTHDKKGDKYRRQRETHPQREGEPQPAQPNRGNLIP